MANFRLSGETFNSVVESDAPFASLSVECWEVFFFVGQKWVPGKSADDLSGMVHDLFGW